jgi:hypothetical protein
VKKTANKKTIDGSLYLHRWESRRHFCRQKSSTLVFFLLFFPLLGQQLGYGLKWRFCRWKCKLWMTHYSVSGCLQNPQIFFCFGFGEIHSGSDASRGPSEVKYSAKVHVRSALCHLFGVRGARNCSWHLFYAESVTLHSLCCKIMYRICHPTLSPSCKIMCRICHLTLSLSYRIMCRICHLTLSLSYKIMCRICHLTLSLSYKIMSRICHLTLLPSYKIMCRICLLHSYSPIY